MIENRQLKELGVITLSANGHSSIINTKAYRIVTLSVGVDATADLTLQVKGATESHQTTDVDLTAAQGLSNRWDYIQVINNEDGSTVDGDTGISPTVATTDDDFEFAINVDGIKRLCLDVSTWTAGGLTAVITLFND